MPIFPRLSSTTFVNFIIGNARRKWVRTNPLHLLPSLKNHLPDPNLLLLPCQILLKWKSTYAQFSLEKKEIIDTKDETKIHGGNDESGADTAVGSGMKCSKEDTDRSTEATTKDAQIQLISPNFTHASNQLFFPTVQCAPSQQRYDTISKIMKDVCGERQIPRNMIWVILVMRS
jgi:hypothetical protein